MHLFRAMTSLHHLSLHASTFVTHPRPWDWIMTILGMNIPLESPQPANPNNNSSTPLSVICCHWSVTDVNYHPLSGYVGNLTGAQRQNLVRLKEELVERPRSFCEGKKGWCDAFEVGPVNYFLCFRFLPYTQVWSQKKRWLVQKSGERISRSMKS